MSQPEQGRRIREGNDISRRVNFENDMLDRILVGLWGRMYPRGWIPCLGVRVGRGMKVGTWMHMQAYLLHFQGCLTFRTHGTPSLPAAFPGSGACFQGCKDDYGKWHAERFCPALAPFCLE